MRAGITIGPPDTLPCCCPTVAPALSPLAPLFPPLIRVGRVATLIRGRTEARGAQNLNTARRARRARRAAPFKFPRRKNGNWSVVGWTDQRILQKIVFSCGRSFYSCIGQGFQFFCLAAIMTQIPTSNNHIIFGNILLFQTMLILRKAGHTIQLSNLSQ